MKSLLLLIPVLALGAIRLAAQPTPTPTPDDTRRGQLNGRLLDEAGRPLARIGLTAVTAKRQGAGLNATTDDQGRFSFKDLAAGLYYLLPYAPGYVSEDDPFATSYRLGDDVTLRLVKGGVITGTVKDARGEPIVGIGVNATGVRDAETGKTPGTRYSQTDDRGIFRIYGLSAGSYLVAAGGNGNATWPVNAYGNDLAVYYPGVTTRDTASLVAVSAGAETGGIDIRYRQEPGHTVSGQFQTDLKTGYYLLTLTAAKSNAQFFGQTFGGTETTRKFAFTGLPDGDYLLTIQSAPEFKPTRAALSNVTVSGADVTGLALTLSSLGTLRGRIMRDETPWPAECTDKPGLTPGEIQFSARRQGVKPDAPVPFSSARATGEADDTFTLNPLTGGSYHLSWRLASDLWYVRAIERPAPPDNAKTKKAAAPVPAQEPAQLFTLKEGAELAGLTVRLTPGAATVSGRVVPPEDVALPAKLHVYLVPAEKERADDTLRYAAAEVEANGVFGLTNVPPGRYRLVVQPAPAPADGAPFLKSASRAQLRRAAEAANQVLDLLPCQRVSARTLPYLPR